MYVEVVDRLPSGRAAIDHQAVAVVIEAGLARQLIRHKDYMTHQSGLSFREIRHARDMCCGNHDEVRRCLRTDVRKRDGLRIVMHALGRNAPGHDLAEQARRHAYEVACCGGTPSAEVCQQRLLQKCRPLR